MVEEGGAPDIDQYEPVDILSMLPKDFWEKLKAKQWQERKEALDSLEQLLLQTPILERESCEKVVHALENVRLLARCVTQHRPWLLDITQQNVQEAFDYMGCLMQHSY